MPDRDDDSVLIEMIQLGNAVKVIAVDPKSGVEASIVGPATASVEELKRNAVRKLDYVLAKGRGR